jgi:hypothetical protein
MPHFVGFLPPAATSLRMHGARDHELPPGSLAPSVHTFALIYAGDLLSCVSMSILATSHGTMFSPWYRRPQRARVAPCKPEQHRNSCASADGTRRYHVTLSLIATVQFRQVVASLPTGYPRRLHAVTANETCPANSDRQRRFWFAFGR